MNKTILACLLCLPSLAYAEVGRVISLRGEASVTRGTTGSHQRAALERGASVEQGDQIRTGADSAIRIVFSDRSLLNIGPNASVVIQDYTVAKSERRRRVGIKLWAGRAWARVTTWFGSGENRFEVKTPNAVAGVRGTEFAVNVDPDGETTVTVFEGAVEVGPLDPSAQLAMLSPGQRGRVKPDGTTQTESVPSGELQRDRQSSQRSGGLDPKSRSQRVQNAVEGVNRPQGSTGPDGPDSRPDRAPATDGPGDGAPPDMVTPPPLDLDPATGESRVRGRVEFRE
ncbi:MAG: FecR domain-containing protein [Myxococcota bacterium]